MTKILATFPEDRFFNLWFYTPSHSQLLLRSNKFFMNPEIKTRVDVCFGAVEGVCIPAASWGLRVALGKPENLDLPLPASLLKYLKLYVVQGRLNDSAKAGEPFTGYVVGGSFAWTEDDLGGLDPSPLIDFPGAASGIVR